MGSRSLKTPPWTLTLVLGPLTAEQGDNGTPQSAGPSYACLFSRIHNITRIAFQLFSLLPWFIPTQLDLPDVVLSKRHRPLSHSLFPPLACRAQPREPFCVAFILRVHEGNTRLTPWVTTIAPRSTGWLAMHGSCKETLRVTGKGPLVQWVYYYRIARGWLAGSTSKQGWPGLPVLSPRKTSRVRAQPRPCTKTEKKHPVHLSQSRVCASAKRQLGWAISSVWAATRDIPQWDIASFSAQVAPVLIPAIVGKLPP